MKGIITGVINPKGARFCFIAGDDGRKYFCMRHDFMEGRISAWSKYCYNGNKCTFDVIDDGLHAHLMAKNVVAELAENPDRIENQKKAAELMRMHEEKQQIKMQRIKEQKMREERNQRNKQYEESRKIYVVEIRGRDNDSEWRVLKPIISGKSSEEIKVICNSYKVAYPDYMFRVGKVLMFDKLGIIRDYKRNEYGKIMETSRICHA